MMTSSAVGLASGGYIIVPDPSSPQDTYYELAGKTILYKKRTSFGSYGSALGHYRSYESTRTFKKQTFATYEEAKREFDLLSMEKKLLV